MSATLNHLIFKIESSILTCYIHLDSQVRIEVITLFAFTAKNFNVKVSILGFIHTNGVNETRISCNLFG